MCIASVCDVETSLLKRNVHDVEERQSVDGEVFFFQAEDGIRDPLVTGVQTCALPISRRNPDARGAAPGFLRVVPPDNPVRLARSEEPSCRERVQISVVAEAFKKL